jgi:hypothetical protein
MEYPKKFPVCPHCGSMVRVIESEAMQELAKGNLKVVTRASCLTTETAIFDPTSPIIAARDVPVVRAFYDICADCGSLYCVEIDKASARAQPQFRRNNHKQHL